MCQLFSGLFQFIGPQGGNCLSDFANIACGGKVLVMIQSIIQGAPTEALRAFSIIAATIIIFLAVVWAQSLKVKVPLVYDKLRGYGIEWPLSFFYANVLPVILVSALAANLQLFAGLLEGWLGHSTWLGTFSQGTPTAGLAFWLSPVNILDLIVTGRFQWIYLAQTITHILYYIVFAAIFSVFWVKTSGMDAGSQARNILKSGLQIPGFRKDERVLESILKRYIGPLTIMGGAAVGFLAAIADSLGAITSGTGILLAVMIMYQFYQNIAQQHSVDMHPAMKKLTG